MKQIARCTFFLLLFVLASTASRADSVVVGSLDLINVIPGPGGVDSLLLTNITGSGTPTTDQALTFTVSDLVINGVDQTANLLANGNDVAGLYYELDYLAQDSITSFDLTASLGTSPLWVTVNGVQELLDPTVSLSYSGPVLDTNSAVNNDVQLDIDATTTPEPSTFGLFGTGMALLGLALYSRSRHAQALKAGEASLFTGIA